MKPLIFIISLIALTIVGNGIYQHSNESVECYSEPEVVEYNSTSSSNHFNWCSIIEQSLPYGCMCIGFSVFLFLFAIQIYISSDYSIGEVFKGFIIAGIVMVAIGILPIIAMFIWGVHRLFFILTL